MAKEFICKYCGTHQPYSGSGSMVCEQCGATQSPESTPNVAAVTSPARRGSKVWLVLSVLTLLGFGLLWQKNYRSHALDGSNTQGAMVVSRVMKVVKPVVHLLPKDVSFTPEDIVNAVPKVSFPAEALQIVSQEKIPDQDNRRVFVAELKNTSPNLAVATPVGSLQLTRGNKVVYTGTLTSEDLAPGQSSPFMVKPEDVNGAVFDHVRVQWSPLQGYSPSSSRAAQLEAQITSQKVSPTTETVNFTQTFHYNTMDIHGTVRNTGRASAHHVKIYAVLRDPKGGLAGYAEQDVTQSLAPGAKEDFEVSVDEWGGAVAKVDVIPVQLTPP
jgi:hypothetical protein